MWFLYRNRRVSNAFRLCAYPAVLSLPCTVCAVIASPMPFGCVPIRQSAMKSLQFRAAEVVSNAFRLCAYPAVAALPEMIAEPEAEVSNAFRLCAYPAVGAEGLAIHAALLVSNAFRLCAYPAEVDPSHRFRNSPGLQCLSAVCLSGRGIDKRELQSVTFSLQCLSAVCLSGRTGRKPALTAGRRKVSNAFRLCAYPAEPFWLTLYGRAGASPMPFGCVPIRQLAEKEGDRFRIFWVSNAFRLCAYPAGAPRRFEPDASDIVSNAFRLCAYPAESPGD